MKDFFVSYSSADKLWAEWITWQLEQAGYSILLQSWSFEPGPNFMQRMLDAMSETQRMIVVLSPDYLDELETYATWAQVLRQDPTGTQGTLTLLPVQVRVCQDRLKGVLSLLSYIDLVGRDEDAARDILLAGVQTMRSKPSNSLDYPIYREHVVVEQPAFPINFPRIWNVPPRNRFFTDREEILEQLHATFASKTMGIHILSQAISGLGGIGKTQIAIEYAYRYCTEYQAVLWLFAESRDMLVQSCYNLARTLALPQKDAQDHEELVGAVREWLQDHVDWLLILDNADDTSLVRAFLPSGASGHVLITTRAQAVGRVAQGIFIYKMTPEEGALFLLRRAGLLGQEEALNVEDKRWQAAIRIAEEMDGLPLALDQAGSYIEEIQCSLTGYLTLYQKYRQRLLGRRGEQIFDHPEPVTTTWNLSFERIEQANLSAADLLRFCAFLAPEDISEELVIEGTIDINSPLSGLAGDQFAINEVIAELLRYSLLHRDSQSKTLSIHRLVQEVFREMLSEEEQRIWAERAVRAVNAVFPNVTFETWAQCQRYLPHVRVCVISIAQWHMIFPEAANLHHHAGLYLQERAQYADAEQLFQQALAIYEQIGEAACASLVQVMNDLASLSVTMGKYPEAEQYYLKSIAVIEHNWGSEHPDLIDALNKLLAFYINQVKYSQALPIAQRVLALSEKILEPDHPDIAVSLLNLAWIYREQGEYGKAEPFAQRALAIREQILGSTHPGTAISLNNLAVLYKEQGKDEEAELLYKRALSINEQVLGAMHLDTAINLSNLASLYQDQGKYEETELLYQRALAIDEQILGLEHPGIATDFNNLASLYQEQGKYEEAESLYKRAFSIYEGVLGSDHPSMATSLNNLASLYQEQGKYEEAEPLYKRALSIWEQVLGSNHPDTANGLNNLASLYQEQGKYEEAEPLYKRALSIREQALGSDHPSTIRTRKALSDLLRKAKGEGQDDSGELVAE